MDPIILAFITGLTTGGLSCLAVQGGLLASSLARQIEQDLLVAPTAQPGAKTGQPSRRAQPNTALPIALFLAAKLAAYTLLGALLGWLGSFLTLDPITRAALMILIGVFMVGNGLRMLNVHPIFRYFVIQPPRFITRAIRRTAKRDTDLAAPVLLGALTVLIPCGVTQAMMAAALGTGSAALGAALMFAFTLGTSPVFFVVAYLATQLGARLESWFLRFVAVVVLILGLVTVESGLNLLGSPISFASLTRTWGAAAEAVPETAPDSVRQPSAAAVALPTAAAAGATRGLPQALATLAPATNVEPVLELRVLNNGYSPRVLRAPANRQVTLALVTNKTYSCARDFVIPGLKYYQLLPDTGRVTMTIPPQKPGTVMRFACSMGMYTGQIVFEG
jgi:sulfite exporter TauE/SafE